MIAKLPFTFKNKSASIRPQMLGLVTLYSHVHACSVKILRHPFQKSVAYGFRPHRNLARAMGPVPLPGRGGTPYRLRRSRGDRPTEFCNCHEDLSLRPLDTRFAEHGDGTKGTLRTCTPPHVQSHLNRTAVDLAWPWRTCRQDGTASGESSRGERAEHGDGVWINEVDFLAKRQPR